MERLIGEKIDRKLFNVPYTINDEYYKTLTDDIDTKYQIMSVVRLTGYKRVHHVIKALSLIKNPPKYVVVGKGALKEELQRFAKYLGVDVEFKGQVSDEEKAKIIKESLFTVHPWACLPVGEAAYFKKVSICYFDPLVYARNKDLAVYVEHNNIEALAAKIEELANNEELSQQLGNRSYDVLVNKKSEIYLMKDNSDAMNTIFNEATK